MFVKRWMRLSPCGERALDLFRRYEFESCIIFLQTVAYKELKLPILKTNNSRSYLWRSG